MKLTPWFTSGQKPVREGVYEVLPTTLPKAFSYWNGKRWSWICRTKEEAKRRRATVTKRQDCQWRGLAEGPKQ